MSVLLETLDWRIKIRESAAQLVGLLVIEHISENTTGQLAHHSRPFLTQLDQSIDVAHPRFGKTLSSSAEVFGSDDVVSAQILR